MGVDATIYISADDDFEELLEDSLPLGFSVERVNPNEDYPDVTHEIEPMERLYSDGYERGSWPKICACLMALFASRGVNKIWYGGDSSPDPISPADVLRISDHYMRCGHRPYREPPRGLKNG